MEATATIDRSVNKISIRAKNQLFSSLLSIEFECDIIPDPTQKDNMTLITTTVSVESVYIPYISVNDIDSFI